MSHHQLIYCTKKVTHYAVNVFPEELQKVSFSNYEHFSCIDVACTGFLNKLIKVTNETPANKEIRIKNNTPKLFELTHACEFFFFFFFILVKKITKMLILKLKILLVKTKENSMKLILDKK